MPAGGFPYRYQWTASAQSCDSRQIPYGGFTARCLGFEADLKTRCMLYHLARYTGEKIDAIPSDELQTLSMLTGKPDSPLSGQIDHGVILIAEQKERLRDGVAADMRHRIDARWQGRKVVKRASGRL